MSFQILDNYLTKEDLKNIKNILFPQDLTSKDNFQWNYQKGIVRDPDLGPTGYEEYDWMYNRSLYSSEFRLKFDKYYHVVKPILNKLNPKKIFDIRANLLVPTPHHIYHEFHTDRSVPHRVALFYVTTNNGFTILRDQPKINCIENRMLLFNGNIEHHSVTSTDSPRCVLNINYL
jgi:hypothetical protein